MDSFPAFFLHFQLVLCAMTWDLVLRAEVAVMSPCPNLMTLMCNLLCLLQMSESDSSVVQNQIAHNAHRAFTYTLNVEDADEAEE